MRMLPIAVAAVLLGVLPGICTEAFSQGGGDRDPDRLGEVERRVEEAEDVIVEQVLALRRQMEALEERVRVLEAARATAPATTRTPPERLR